MKKGQQFWAKIVVIGLIIAIVVTYSISVAVYMF